MSSMFLRQICAWWSSSWIVILAQVPDPYALTIQPEDLKAHTYVLASDSLEGRETGEIGQHKAAHYLANTFKNIGLRPPVQDTAELSYFQDFVIQKVRWDEVVLETDKKVYKHLENMLYLSNASRPHTELLEVMAGSTYVEVQESLSGKLLAYKASSVSEWRQYAARARQKGSLGALIFVETKAFEEGLKNYTPYLNTRYFFTTVPTSQSEDLAIILPSEAFKSMFRKSISHLEKEHLLRTTISFRASTLTENIHTENVLGYLEGTTKKDEIVLVTAHYDHLGKRKKEVYYGADDNASGTAALLEIAEAFTKASEMNQRPKRSLLFMALTGEEKGLLGSHYYTQQPVFPLSQTVTNLNVDMIGRVDENHLDDPDYVYLIGSDRLSTQLHTISEEVNARYVQLKLDYRYNAADDPNRFYERSDHYNFAKHNIPIIFYFNGTHTDYHKPTDTPDKLLYGKMTKIARLIFYTAWTIANREERPALDKEQ